MSTQQTFECAHCGKVYKTRYISKEKFCSRVCQKAATEAKRVRICESCNKQFVKTSSSDGKFCSFECYAESLKGKRPHNYSRVELECLTCGKLFEVERGRANIAQYCSRECTNKGRSTNDKRVCIHCGVEFKVWSARKDSARFCSRKCQGLHYRGQSSPVWNSIEVSCAECGKNIHVPPHRIKLAKLHFCDLVCRGEWLTKNQLGSKHAAWKGGYKSYYGPDWETQKRKALERDAHTCQYCKKRHKKGQRLFDVHHIRPFREFEYLISENENHKLANDLSNLITLCRECHKLAEHGKIAFQPKLI